VASGLLAARPEAVVFDNDGLLLDTEGLWTKAQVKLFAAHGRPFGLEHKRAFVGVAGPLAEERLERMLDAPGRGAELLEELNCLVMREALATGAEPMPGAPELVDALRADGIPLALVSNSPVEWVEAVLAPSGIGERFELVLTPDDGLEHKPDPALYREACRRLGAEPVRSVGLEDTATGIAAAKSAGLAVIGVPSIPGVELEGADLIATSLADAEVWRALGLSRSA
jgi:HAD superfamily hydrolase (TIGR01509 family)